MSIAIFRGIQLASLDLELLSLGKLTCVPFKQFVKEGESLWLYPNQEVPFGLSLEKYYKQDYQALASEAFGRNLCFPDQVKVWGRCDFHWHIHSENKHLLPKIAQSTIWSLDALEQIFDQYNVLKLLFLRVYRLSEPCILNEIPQGGSFFWFQPEDKVVAAREQDEPAVSDASFKQRKALMMAGEVYPHTRLEALQFSLKPLESSNPDAKQLNHQIKKLLGWHSHDQFVSITPEWMNDIAALGKRSKEEEAKNNYQAGTDFENVVRHSLEHLGFTVDYAHRGGAGGLDLYCSEPYALVGECKSGKSIPNATAVQLLNLGTLRLADKEAFSRAAKLIIGPGHPTDQLKKAAIVHGMAIINPRTLEKLVKVHHKYPIDLFKLRDYLVDGHADDEVNRFIDQHIEKIELRASIIQLVKNFLENSLDTDADVAQLYAIHVVSQPPQPLKREEIHEILIELSSPLLGYLGRRKGDDGGDRFYFLRDLPEVELSHS